PPSGWDLVRDFFYLRGADGLEFAVYNSYDLEYYNVWAGNENVEINNFNYLSKSRFGGIAKITSGNEVQHYIKDHLGSIRVTIDDDNQVLSAQDYDPWGFMLHERTYNQENTTYKFTGKQRDNETEYDYFGARYYDSRIGRWTSIDPLYNLDLNYSPFAYVSNNPLYFIDPNGQFKYPTKYENEYSKNYSKFTQMLKNISIIENDNSLLDAISKFSGLSLNRIKDDFKWGNGPFIEFIDIPGDNLGMFKTGISSDVLT
ncbi:MAG: hypothetical protein IAE65_10405, partial [Ignavibacteria bacterium]|nr:hypothetical protein [Ignavibacteria bacterium]